MLHFLTKSAPNMGSAASPLSSERRAAAPILIRGHEVLFGTAAATLLPSATAHRRFRGTTLTAAIGRIHIRLPEPRPIYPRRDASYFEEARMARHMDHL